jgi:hypothetical protein
MISLVVLVEVLLHSLQELTLIRGRPHSRVKPVESNRDSMVVRERISFAAYVAHQIHQRIHKVAVAFGVALVGRSRLVPNR